MRTFHDNCAYLLSETDHIVSPVVSRSVLSFARFLCYRDLKLEILFFVVTIISLRLVLLVLMFVHEIVYLMSLRDNFDGAKSFGGIRAH